MNQPTREQLTIRCDSSSFKKVHEFVRSQAATAGFNKTDIGRLVLAVDEVCSNIVKHTYHFEPNHKIVVSWNDRPDSSVIEIEDDSPTPYLPSPTDFDLPTKVKYRHTNGYGKYLIRKIVDDVHYETVPGSHNKVSLVKFHTGKGSVKKEIDPLNPYELAKSRSLSLMMLFEVGEVLSRQQSMEDLVKTFLYAVMGRLTTQPVALLGPISAAAPFGLVGQEGLSKNTAVEEFALPRHGWVIETLWAQRGPFLVDEFRKLRIPKEELNVLDRLRAAVLIPLFVANRLRGVLALGSKRSGQSFSEEDINLVTFLGTHVLLLHENMERGVASSGGVPAKLGGEFRAAARAAVTKLASASRESNITIDFQDEKALPSLTIEAEILQKAVLTLLTHILYLASEGSTINLKLESHKGEGCLKIAYEGRPLAFEKGKPGFNPLIDQMMAGSLRLNDCLKVVQSAGGRIDLKAGDPEVTVSLFLPFVT